MNVEIAEETENEYEVEEILEARRISGRPHYLVRWKGYDTSENTWEPIENLRGCPQLVQQFHQKNRQPGRISPSPPEQKGTEDRTSGSE
jgi:hypothetical protein